MCGYNYVEREREKEGEGEVLTVSQQYTLYRATAYST